MLSTGAGRLRMKIIDAAGIKGVTGEKILQLPAEVVVVPIGSLQT